jgi:hypothetical protein
VPLFSLGRPVESDDDEEEEEEIDDGGTCDINVFRLAALKSPTSNA